jgi:hypothetical protein
MAIIKIDRNIKETVAGKTAYKKVGEAEVYVPLLEEFGITAEQAQAEGKPQVTDDGLPVYTKDDHNFLLSAIVAAVKVNARNKLKADGGVIPMTLADLLAESESNSGKALEAIRNLKAAFAKWVAGLGKAVATQTMLIQAFGSKQVLAAHPAGTREKLAGYFTDFAATLSEDDLLAGKRYLDSLLDTCTATVELDDF